MIYARDFRTEPVYLNGRPFKVGTFCWKYYSPPILCGH